jgi:hypothetical protein
VLDSSQQFTVVTQFHAGSGDSDLGLRSASGDLMNISRFYLQNGNRVDLPTLYVLPPADGQHMFVNDPGRPFNFASFVCVLVCVVRSYVRHDNVTVG